MPLQFAYFCHDYHRGYRVRSSYWFEGNIRGAIENILARADHARPPAVYLATDIDWVDWYWRFYLNKYGRQELLDRAVYFDPKTVDIDAIPPGSIVLARYDPSTPTLFEKRGAQSAVARIAEPEGARPLFDVFNR